MRRALLLIVVLLAGPPQAAEAQDSGANRKRLPQARMCDQRFKLLMLRVEDSTGAPIAGVTMTRQRDGRKEPPLTEVTSATGTVNIADDADLRGLPPEGAAFTVTLKKAAKTRRVKIQLGADEGGCHIVLRSGPAVVTF